MNYKLKKKSKTQTTKNENNKNTKKNQLLTIKTNVVLF